MSTIIQQYTYVVKNIIGYCNNISDYIFIGKTLYKWLLLLVLPEIDRGELPFKTLAKSVLDKEGAWQSIILDHADNSIYSGIEGVHEVEEWRYGKKLIPAEWIE